MVDQHHDVVPNFLFSSSLVITPSIHTFTMSRMLLTYNITNWFEVRFLDLVSPFQKWLPEIISPERKVPKLATSPHLSQN